LFLDSAAIENFIKNKAVAEPDAQALRGFYNPRNFGYAWFAHDGLTEQGRAFWHAYTYEKGQGQKDTGLDKSLNKRLDTLLNIDTLAITTADTTIRDVELALTLKFIQYRQNSGSENLMNNVPLTRLIPVKKIDPLAMADSILKENNSGDTTNKQYALLKNELARYDSLAKKGGWPPIVATGLKLKKGAVAPVITSVKKRLQLTNDFSATDTSSKFNDSLDVAIRSYQQRNGFHTDGIITDSLVAIMNVPAEARIQQILVNMTRMLWLPPQVQKDYVEVNVPEFMLRVYEGGSKVFDMPVVVGKEGTNTMMFTGDLNEIVFSPYWNVPASIVKSEVLPEMQSNPNYLKEKRMEVVNKNDTLPVIRQLPGPGNALGRVKFLFPNSYDIFLHDTEAKDLFGTNKRAFSHGCIRLEDAEKMAGYVLRDQQNWSIEKIRAAMNSGKEQRVAVKKKMPVLISYFTAWVDDEGKLNLRDDIYTHDRRMAHKLFIQSPSLA
jgi:murein L,D-transpeptidase YcbB/YkuD